MSFRLLVFNPSDYPRGGHVTTAWQPIYERCGIEPSELMLRDESGVPLPFQVDETIPGDPSQTMLSFSLAEPLQPGHEDYPLHSPSALVMGEKLTRPEFPSLPVPCIQKGVNGETARIRLENNKPMLVRFNLIPAPDDPARPWYAGSATSVRLDNREVLDYNWQNPLGHDHEKRSMQLDYIQFPNPAWDAERYQQVKLFDKPYQLESASAGPVRAHVTVSSEPFPYFLKEPGQPKPRHISCRLIRSFSLFKDADYVIEELYVEGEYPDESRTRMRLSFEAHFFSYLHFQELNILRQPDCPDWFAAVNLEHPFNGYGFAVDVHTQWIDFPHSGFPVQEREGYSFSWLLGPGNQARCLHLFLRLENFPWLEGEDYWSAMPRIKREAERQLKDRTGAAWYEHIFKPLRAVLD